MVYFNYLKVILVGTIILASLHATVSLTGPYSKESRELVKKIRESSESTPILDALRVINSIDYFHADFRELSQKKVRDILTPAIQEPVLEAIIQILKKNTPRRAISHLNPYNNADYSLLLAKIAFLTHHIEILQSLIPRAGQEFATNAFFMTLYEAKPDDLETAKRFIALLSRSVGINSTNEIGFTPLAVAAVTKASPELTKIILDLKPDVNFVMTSLFPGKTYTSKGQDFEPTQDTQFMTVLNLVENSLKHEQDPTIKKNLVTIKDMLIQAGAQTTQIWRWLNA
ncbi:MAG: hypothetical protein K2X90_01770 [Candidatus Babeliaceae bacterium]|nr:hypothetical protein [Candidatus Babeliaceae bacterium]